MNMNYVSTFTIEKQPKYLRQSGPFEIGNQKVAPMVLDETDSMMFLSAITEDGGPREPLLRLKEHYEMMKIEDRC